MYINQHTLIMISRIPVTKARTGLGGLLKRVHLNKEFFILEKDGFPIAGLVDIDKLEDILDAENINFKKEAITAHKDFEKGDFASARDLL